MTRERDGRRSHYVRLSSHAVDPAIGAVAARQQGNITRRQLLDVGLDKHAIHYRVRIGRLYRVHRGVYAVGRPPVTPLERASAAVLACARGAALSHGSAMALWGFWTRWDEPFEVIVPGDRRAAGITIHRSGTMAWRDLTIQHGIRATSPARTVFDTSPRLGDRALRRVVSDALHSAWLSEEQLLELVTRLGHLPAAGRIAPLLGLPGTPTRSGFEDEFVAFCRRYRLPAPTMGARVGGYVVDALFPRERVIVELDGWAYHRDAIAFRADRERDADTLAAGYVTVRITWERIHGTPEREAARLHAILEARAHAPSAA